MPHKARMLLCSKGHYYLGKEAAAEWRIKYPLLGIFISYTSGGGLVSRLYKEFKKKHPEHQENK